MTESIVMLRITIDRNPQVLKLRLEGRLEGEWAALAAESWSSERATKGSRQIRVDLNDVTFIDAEGKILLARMHKAGAEFIARDPMTKAILTELASSP